MMPLIRSRPTQHRGPKEERIPKVPENPPCSACGHSWKAHTESGACPEFFNDAQGLNYRAHPSSRYTVRKGG